MGVAVGQHEAADPLRMAGDEHLGHGPAAVVADDRHVLEVHRLQEIGDRRGDPVGGEVGVGLHRHRLRADRPVGRQAAAAIGEAVDDAVPEPAVDEVAVDEDDRFALARLAVADAAVGEVDLGAVGRLGCGAHCILLGNAVSSLVSGKLHTHCMNVKKGKQDEVGAGRGRLPPGAARPSARRRPAAPSSTPPARSSPSAATPRSAPRRSCAAAGVTRGALYHHFDGKRDLFEAVYEQIEVELAERIAAGALNAGAAAPLDAMRAGAEMFLRDCTEREVQQIALLDGPSVLGWDRWREIGASTAWG